MPIRSCAYSFCDQNDQIAPVLRFQYRAKQYGIFLQQQPVLIHKADQFTHKLPGLELIRPPGGHS
jgi:hypothetical protein